MTPRRASAASATALALAIAAVIALTGCSQVQALAPVGGNRLAEVRFAVMDVLTRHDVAILTAPVCSSDRSGTVVCTGTAVGHRPLVGRSDAGTPTELRVSAGSDVLYAGPLQDVLDAAARAAS